MELRYIKVESEWDIGGQFGGDDNQDIFTYTVGDIVELLTVRYAHLADMVDMTVPAMISEGLLSWSLIELEEL